MGFRSEALPLSNHLGVYPAGLFFLFTPLPVDAADQPELMVQNGADSPATVLRFAGNGRLLASWSQETANLLLWDWTSGQKLRHSTLRGWERTGSADVAFTNGDKRIELLSFGEIRFLDAQTGVEDTAVRIANPPAEEPAGTTSQLSELIISPDGRYGATFSGGRTAITIWDTGKRGMRLTITPPTTKTRRRIRTPVPPAFLAAAFSPDGTRLGTWHFDSSLIATSSSSTICIWDVASGRLEGSIPSTGSAFRETGRVISFSPDGAVIAVLAERVTTISFSRLPQDLTVEHRVMAWDVHRRFRAAG